MTSAKWTTRAAARVALAGLFLSIGVTPVLAANFDGTKPLICAITTIMECDAGQCDRYAPEGTPAGAPRFFKVDVSTKEVTASAGRKSTLGSSAHIDGRLVLHGGENGRGWTATIDEDSGEMSAAVIDKDHTFSLFGACTTP
jgi:hypothetical protein